MLERTITLPAMARLLIRPDGSYEVLEERKVTIPFDQRAADIVCGLYGGITATELINKIMTEEEKDE